MNGIIRVKCPKCGNVVDIAGTCPCQKCGTMLAPHPAAIQLYRMGSPLGVAAGSGIYINDQPYGHVANTQSVVISLPYGTYKLHVTLGMTRKCTDLAVTLTPEAPIFYVKSRIKPGFISNTIILEPSTPDQMPR